MERYNFTLLSKYELTDSLRFKAEAWFARTDATELINQSGYNSRPLAACRAMVMEVSVAVRYLY